VEVELNLVILVHLLLQHGEAVMDGHFHDLTVAVAATGQDLMVNIHMLRRRGSLVLLILVAVAVVDHFRTGQVQAGRV
jgi:hypothetical protein